MDPVGTGGATGSLDDSTALPQSEHGWTPPSFSKRPGKGKQAMLSIKALLIAAPIAVGLLAAPAAHAEWRHGGGAGWGHGGGGGWGHGGGGGHGGGWGYRHGGFPLGGALLGL